MTYEHHRGTLQWKHLSPGAGYPGNGTYYKGGARIGSSKSALCDTLSAPQRELFDEYKKRVSHLSDLYNLEFYREGVRFGVAFLLEAPGVPGRRMRLNRDNRPLIIKAPVTSTDESIDCHGCFCHMSMLEDIHSINSSIVGSCPAK